jgi:alanine racemase
MVQLLSRPIPDASELLLVVMPTAIRADITQLPQAGVGSSVVLWGAGLPADDVAAAAGTVSYELFCALAERVPVIERL